MIKHRGSESWHGMGFFFFFLNPSLHLVEQPPLNILRTPSGLGLQPGLCVWVRFFKSSGTQLFPFSDRFPFSPNINPSRDQIFSS